MPWWPGFQRNADNTGWTGDWDDPQLRPGLRLYPASSVFDPPVISHTLSPWSPAIALQLLQSPYEVMKNLSGGLWPPWKPWFEGDEDCDLWNMIQPERLRLSWRHPEAPQQRPDRRVVLSDNRARIGPKTPKYTSKRRLELVDGVKEAFLDKPNMVTKVERGLLILVWETVEYRSTNTSPLYMLARRKFAALTDVAENGERFTGRYAVVLKAETGSK
ncbi:hypothetical protein CGCTS75_v006723 [Colletotrichum tropicale]|nr:hypothetical protein CGCTS75_v006723 [Colletotrichum tropicale]